MHVSVTFLSFIKFVCVIYKQWGFGIVPITTVELIQEGGLDNRRPFVITRITGKGEEKSSCTIYELSP